MNTFSKLFGTKSATESNVDIIDDEMLLNCKGVSEETLKNLSDNRGEENK